MDWLSEYIKAWSRLGISFTDEIRHFNVLLPPREQIPLIVEDECLVYRFPHSYRDKHKRGQVNERFLNPSSLLRLLDGLPGGMMLVLPIPEIWRTEQLPFGAFMERFERFLASLPAEFHYAIQGHTPQHLLPDYFSCLRNHQVAHVIHGRFSGLPPFTADFGVIHTAELSLIAQVVRYAIEEKKKLFVHCPALNDLMELLNEDLKRLSLFRRQHAA